MDWPVPFTDVQDRIGIVLFGGMWNDSYWKDFGEAKFSGFREVEGRLMESARPSKVAPFALGVTLSPSKSSILSFSRLAVT